MVNGALLTNKIDEYIGKPTQPVQPTGHAIFSGLRSIVQQPLPHWAVAISLMEAVGIAFESRMQYSCMDSSEPMPLSILYHTKLIVY
jgi:hypothetical protein